MGLFKKYVEIKKYGSSKVAPTIAQLKKTGRYVVVYDDDKLVSNISFENIPDIKEFPFIFDGNLYRHLSWDGDFGKRTFSSVVPAGNGDFIVKSFHESNMNYVNHDGAMLYDEEFRTCFPIVDGYGRVEMLDKSGFTFIYEGKVLPFRFFEARDFVNGFAAVKVKKNNRWTFLRNDGKLLNQTFLNVDDFDGKYAVVEAGRATDTRRLSLLDNKGNLADERFMKINKKENGEYECWLDGGSKLIYKNGKITEQSWLNVLKNHPSKFSLLPTERFRNPVFIEKCLDTIQSSLKFRSSKLKEIGSDYEEYVEKLTEMIKDKIVTEQGKILSIDMKEQMKEEDRERQKAEELERAKERQVKQKQLNEMVDNIGKVEK